MVGSFPHVQLGEHVVLRGLGKADQPLQSDRAIADLDAGTYGRCRVCGGPIAVERLLALPGGTVCVACAR